MVYIYCTTTTSNGRWFLKIIVGFSLLSLCTLTVSGLIIISSSLSVSPSSSFLTLFIPLVTAEGFLSSSALSTFLFVLSSFLIQAVHFHRIFTLTLRCRNNCGLSSLQSRSIASCLLLPVVTIIGYPHSLLTLILRLLLIAIWLITTKRGAPTTNRFYHNIIIAFAWQ